MVRRGIFPPGGSVALPETPYLYDYGAIRVLGYMEKVEHDEGRKERLVETSPGIFKLQLWQLFNFNQGGHIPFYRASDFKDKILPMFSSPSVAQHGLCGYQALLRGKYIPGKYIPGKYIPGKYIPG